MTEEAAPELRAVEEEEGSRDLVGEYLKVLGFC